MPGEPHVCCARGRYQDESVGAECQVVQVGEDKGLEARGDVESIPQMPASPLPRDVHLHRGSLQEERSEHGSEPSWGPGL